MPLSTATITFDLADMLGVDFDPRRTKVWVTTNVPNDTVIDTDANKIRLGSGSVTVNADGTGSLTVWTPGAGAYPATWQTYIHADYPDRHAHHGRSLRVFGPFTITDSGDLADLVQQQEFAPDFGEVITRDEFEAAVAAVEEISGLTGEDAAVAALVNNAGSSTRAALSNVSTAATDAAKSDPYAIQRLDRQGNARARLGAGKALQAFTDATEVVKDWTNLSGVNAVANAQVSGNKFYAVNSTAPGGFTFPFNIPNGTRAHIQTLLYWKAGSTTAPVYFGIDCGTSNHALIANEPDALSVGISGAGARSRIVGASLNGPLTSGLTPAAIGADPTTDSTYILTVDVDDVWITFQMKKVGSTGDAYYWGVLRSQLAATGKTPNNIFCYLTDSRGTAGHALGPVVATKSLQPARTRTVAGQAIEGSDHRLRSTALSQGGDPMFYGLPASYDPRTPAPVVLFCHQSLTGNAISPWNEGRMRPVTEALLDAGYIVAACNTDGDRYGNSNSLSKYLDLYNHLRDTYATGPLFLFGASMGGLDILNIIGRREWPTPAAAAGVGLALSLQSVINAGDPYLTDLRTAYNVASNMSDFTTKTAGYRPEARNGWEYRGVPFRLYTSLTEPTQPAAGQEAFADLIEPWAPVSVVYGTGGHLDNSQYQPTDVLAFFESYR